MNKCTERIYNGIIKENPTFVLMLGMCPTLAVTISAKNGLGMGLTTTVVLVMSNMLISLLRKVIPDKVRMPAFIVVVASFVTIVQMLLKAYLPSLNQSLGIYIPLIVVNCIILGRAESYASKNPVLPSIFDGVGMGRQTMPFLRRRGSALQRKLRQRGLRLLRRLLRRRRQPRQMQERRKVKRNERDDLIARGGGIGQQCCAKPVPWTLSFPRRVKAHGNGGGYGRGGYFCHYDRLRYYGCHL